MIVKKDEPWKKRKAVEHAFGPAMSQLTELQQRYVELVVWEPFVPHYHLLIKAGYKGKPDAALKMTYRLSRDPLIIAAVEEASEARLRQMVPLAITAMENMVKNPSHRHHSRMVDSLLDRTGHTGVTRTENHTTVTHQFDRTQLVASIASLMERNQPALAVRQPVITAIIEAED